MRTLPSWQIPFLGLRQFPRSLTLFEIATFFSFNDEERNAIQSRRGDHLRLAFGIHLGFLEMTGTALSAVDRIPMFVLMQVADELDLPHVDIATVRSLYRRRKRTLYEHQQWAMQLLGIDAFNEHHQRALMRAFRPPVSVYGALLAHGTARSVSFAMGLARLLGFDLCPRLKSLNDRLLHVPVDFPFSPNIASIVRPGLNLSDMEPQWDELVRLTASIKAGKVTTTAVLKRFGSMASGDPLYRTGRTLEDLGRLHEFAAEKNSAASDRIRHQLLDGFRTLLKQPMAGKPVKSLPVRQWVVGDYVVRYLLKDDQVLIIVRIWHGKEDRSADV